jgi:hypothetical protein
MPEAVRFAGGWLFDRVMAGWDVTVLTADHADPRPLRILGARSADLECVLAQPFRGPQPSAMAVCAGLYRADARVRRMVLWVLAEEQAEVRLWDEGRPGEAGGGELWMPHRLSVAARAFKAQAMEAAALSPGPEGATEFFRRGELVGC